MIALNIGVFSILDIENETRDNVMKEERQNNSGTTSGRSTVDISAEVLDDDNDSGGAGDNGKEDERHTDVSVNVVELRQSVDELETPQSTFRQEVQTQFSDGDDVY